MAEPPRRRLVQAGVLDRDSSLGGEKLGQLLVLVREAATALLLGQIQVAVRDSPEQDGHAEEAPHRRMVRRKSDRAGVVPEVVEPQRLRLADQHSQDPAPARQVTDRGVRLGVDAVREEALEVRSGLIDHAEGGEPSSGELRGGLDELLQESVQGELGAERDPRLDEDAQTV